MIEAILRQNWINANEKLLEWDLKADS